MTQAFNIGTRLMITPASGRSKVIRCRLFRKVRGHMIWVSFTPMSGHVVPLLEAPAADLTSKSIVVLGVVFTHVPVQRGLLTAGEATHLAPEKTHTHSTRMTTYEILDSHRKETKCETKQ